MSEAFCPNIQPRAHARLTGSTTARAACVSTWLGKSDTSTAHFLLLCLDGSVNSVTLRGLALTKIQVLL